MALSKAGLVQIGTGVAADTSIIFDGNAVDFHIGLDDSADDLIIGKGSSLGTTPIISMADDGDTKITSTSTATGDAALELHSTGNSNGNYTNLKFTSAGNTSGCFIKSNQASSGNDGRLEFCVNNSGTVGEAMRINYQGIVSISTTETAYANLTQAGDNGIILTDTSSSIFATDQGATMVVARTNADDNNRDIINFNRNGSTCGQITGTNSATTFATSSDYRLKENVTYTWDATTRLKQLKPARFNWISDSTNTLLDGFIAHEVSSVVPGAITGEKDAMVPEVLYTADDELPEGKNIGDVRIPTKIKPQGIDPSKLVPLLVKTVQELEVRIKTLEDA